LRVDSTQWLVRAVPYDCYSRFALYQVRNIVPNAHTHQSILVTHTHKQYHQRYYYYYYCH